jgi:nicotinamide mononucleotide transporter
LDFSQLAGQIADQDAVEWTGLITGMIYVVLAAYERPSCWLFGIASSACIAWKSFFDYLLIADGVLQIFYMIIGIIGLVNWVKGHTVSREKPIIQVPILHHLSAIAICLVISWPVSWVLIHFAFAKYGYVDTLLTFLSIWATILLVRKELNNWWYWIIIDAVYVGLYWVSGGYLFSLLFLLYTVISFWGLRQWGIRLRLQENTGTVL